MGWFRKEPIHKRLARDLTPITPDGLLGQPPALDNEAGLGVAGIHGVPRPRRWDAVVSAEAPGLRGDQVRFVALEGGDLVVDEDEPDETLGPLADAVEQTLGPPYRAEAVRRDGDVWAVAARRIEVAELEADGDELELVVSEDGSRSLTVDGARSFGSLPELERIGSRHGSAFVARATRIDDGLWDVETSAL